MRKYKKTLGGAAFTIATSILVNLTPAVAGEGNISGSSGNRASCGTYTVMSGDTISDIALKETGSRAYTGVVVRMNAGKVKNADEITPGMKLEIPCKSDLTAQDRNTGTGTPKAASGRWSAEAGDFLVPVLSEWGKKAGYEVIVEHNSDWRFGVSYSERGNFRSAVDDVISGFATAAVPPVVVFYTNNVMTIGVR